MRPVIDIRNVHRIFESEADRAVTIRDGRIHDGAYIAHAPQTLRGAIDNLPTISAHANPTKGVKA